MVIELGTPTRHGFNLPEIRYQLCRKAINSLEKRDRLLDYGCGNGANTILFKDSFDDIIGIDVETERIEEGNSYIKKRNINNVNLIRYNGNTVPVSDDSIDLTISFEVLEHTTNDLDAAEEIFRVTKKGGFFCLTIPNKWYLMETHGFDLPFKKVIPYNRVPFLNLMPKPFYKKYGLARIYRKKEITRLLKRAGFEIMEMCYIKPPFDKVNNQIIKRVLIKAYDLLPDFMGVSIFLACKKP